MNMCVEPQGEFLAKCLCILDQRETTFLRWAIIQVKVKWKHFGLDEATWEEEEAKKKAYPTLFVLRKNTKDGVPLQGREL